MNQRLLGHQIRTVYRELVASRGSVSGRQLRLELRRRFGAAGNTRRVFQIWREEAAGPTETNQRNEASGGEDPADITDLRRRLAASEQLVEVNRLRAERAEAREDAHQDRWAIQVDTLRQRLQAQPNYPAEIRKLQDHVLRLTAELNALRQVCASQAKTGTQ